MDILFLLIPIAIGFLIVALAVFFWAIRDGQYDDMESQGLKVIIDDKQQTQAEKRPSQAINNPDDPN
jgi:cbb3-type cytochrome oxidase maturation protein